MENQILILLSATVPAISAAFITIRNYLKVTTGEESLPSLNKVKASRDTALYLEGRISRGTGSESNIAKMKEKLNEEDFFLINGLKAPHEKIPAMYHVRELALKGGLDPFKINYFANFLDV